MVKIATAYSCIFAMVLCFNASAQTALDAPPPEKADASQLDTLTRKIDEQNAKIDVLSQQIQKLELSLAGLKAVPPAAEHVSPSPVPTAIAVAEPQHTPAGSNHVVARGETLTSIAKLHKVTIEDLQKTNHITDDRKLQIGQTLVIPASPSAAASGTATASPTPGG
jgi:LysM repeat protein